MNKRFFVRFAAGAGVLMLGLAGCSDAGRMTGPDRGLLEVAPSHAKVKATPSDSTTAPGTGVVSDGDATTAQGTPPLPAGG